MLDVSRERIPQFRESSILDLVEDVAAVLKVGVGGYGPGSECPIDIQTQVDAQASVFCIDPDRLYRALLNLGLNALDAMPQGGRLRIHARLAADHELEPADAFGPVLRFDVSDTGVGIPPELLSRIYEPFFSTKPSRGTGLGLAATAQFVDEHGGRLLVQSRSGSGTTFTLLLPANDHRQCDD